MNGIIVGSLRYELDPFVLIHVHGADLTQRGRIVRVHDRKMDVDGISAAVVIVNVKAESVIPDVVVRGADPQGAVVGVEKVILFVLQVRYSGLGYVHVVTEGILIYVLRLEDECRPAVFPGRKNNRIHVDIGFVHGCDMGRVVGGLDHHGEFVRSINSKPVCILCRQLKGITAKFVLYRTYLYGIVQKHPVCCKRG